MFYVNNDDIEELFRQAAENYPLKTDSSADWEKVSAALREEAGKAFAEAGNFKKEKKRRVFLWWVLLLPLGWIGHDSWQKLNVTKNAKTVSGSQTQPPQAFADEHASDKQANKHLASIDLHKKNDAFVVYKKPKKNLTNQNNFEARTEHDLMNKKTDKEKNITGTIVSKRNASENKNTIINKSAIANNKNESKNNVGDDDKNKTAIVNDGTLKNSDAGLKTQTDDSQDISAKKNEDALESKTGKLPEPLTKKADQSLQATNANNTKQAKSPVALKKDFHFYAGLMAGADISTVKFQSVKGVGNSVGMLLGFHFSHSRFNIETGIYWDTKKYYTSGEYFNTHGLSYFNNPNVDLNYVNGTCNMFEIPINVRYNFKQNKNTSLFGVIGLSSYLMNKEDYGYGYQYYGTSHYSEYSYYHSTQNWFSVMNLSVGYEHRLGRIGDIRIEPYVKLPLSGIGKGSLSIMSMGLNVGISRRF